MSYPKKFYHEKLERIFQADSVINLSLGNNVMEGLREFQSNHVNSNYRVIDLATKNINNMDSYLIELKQVPSASVGSVICGSALDHVPEPQTLVQEVYRILKPGGQCFLYAPFLYVYHGEGSNYGDYFRFTIDGIRYLVRDFSDFEYAAIRGRAETIVKILPFGKFKKLFYPIARVIDKLALAEKQTSGYYVFVVK